MEKSKIVYLSECKNYLVSILFDESQVNSASVSLFGELSHQDSLNIEPVFSWIITSVSA